MSRIPINAKSDLTDIRKILQQISIIVNKQYVPYSGASQNVDIGSYDFSANDITSLSNLTIGGTSDFTGNAQFDSNINVSGKITSQGDVNSDSDINISGALNVYGISKFESDLDINASIDCSGNAIVHKNFETSGSSNFGGQVICNDIVSFNSGIRKTISKKTSEYTLTDSDYTILASGTFPLNLPQSSDVIGQIFCLKNVGAGTITIDGYLTETIDGATTKALLQNESVMLQSDGNNYFILSSN